MSEKMPFYSEMFTLQMSYLHHRLHREPWWGMDYGFGNFTMLKAISKCADGPRYDLDELPWRKTLADCWTALMQSPSAERARFVDFAWARLGDRWLKAYPVFEAEVANRNDYFGCFRYDFHPADHSLALHFMNKDEAAPLDPERRKADLRRVIQDVEAKHLQPVEVSFDTWMNNIKSVQALFPDAFVKSLSACQEFPKGYGWWGQFISKDGGINSRRADVLIREGRFELARLQGHCSWAEFKASTENS